MSDSLKPFKVTISHYSRYQVTIYSTDPIAARKEAIDLYEICLQKPILFDELVDEVADAYYIESDNDILEIEDETTE